MAFELNEKLRDHPNLLTVCLEIQTLNKFQKKALSRIITGSDQKRLDFGEEWLVSLMHAVGDDAIKVLANDYVEYTKMIRREEMYYFQNQKYAYDDYSEVYDRVYSNDEAMSHYVTGLGMTQIFWENHYRICRFFLDVFLPKVENAQRGAEIGVGHGFFHSRALAACENLTTKIIDVSPYAIEFTKKICAIKEVRNDRYESLLNDIQKHIPIADGELDMLLMGEVIEHLAEGEAVMSNMAKKMSADGYCFFTTAANAPAEDHILLFKSVSEIHSFIDGCGWRIVDEMIATINDIPIKQAEESLSNINYAAVLETK